ncbi:PIG-X [Pisolithus marmoratus]|nr:PIG-X [Pisolithus marmoratus]
MLLSSFAVSPTRGFHSTLLARIALHDEDHACSTFVLYTLPPGVIVDRHELIDRGVEFELWGESNLELPVFAVSQANSSLLLSVRPIASHVNEVLVDVPVHARYGVPLRGNKPRQLIEIPPPTCFRACPQSTMTADASTYSTSEPPVNQSAMLRPYSHFLVSQTPRAVPAARLDVPVGSLDDLPLVEAGTVAVVLAAFLWLAYRSWMCSNKLRSHHSIDKQD